MTGPNDARAYLTLTITTYPDDTDPMVIQKEVIEPPWVKDSFGQRAVKESDIMRAIARSLRLTAWELERDAKDGDAILVTTARAVDKTFRTRQ